MVEKVKYNRREEDKRSYKIKKTIKKQFVGNFLMWTGIVLGTTYCAPNEVSYKDINNEGYQDITVSRRLLPDKIFYGTPSGKYSSLEELEKQNDQIIKNTEEQMRQDFMNKYSPLENKAQSQ